VNVNNFDAPAADEHFPAPRRGRLERAIAGEAATANSQSRRGAREGFEERSAIGHGSPPLRGHSISGARAIQSQIRDPAAARSRRTDVLSEISECGRYVVDSTTKLR
jgi:hypothetical protein